ncbi:MAG: PPC domain-containing protein [Pirellulales bacterium]
MASLVAPEDGNYVIQVRESSFGGSDACTYRLHVGRFPRPTAVYPAGGRPGETLEVRWLGDVAGEWTEQVTLPSESTNREALFAHDERGVAPSGNAIRVNDLVNVLEVEPNGAREQATAFAGAAALNGVIAEPGDVDHFKFEAKKGEVYDVHVHARSLRTPLDPVLNIQRIGGAGVAGNDDSGGPDSYVRFTAPEDDEYVVIVQDHLKQGGSDYVYRVELEPVVPKLTTGLPERSQFVDTTVSVPRGGRTAFLVSASRADFGGDVAVSLPDLPEGVVMEAPTMPANQNEVPVLLSAAAEAPVAGRLVDVVGKLVDENRDVTGHLEQTTSLVRGQNNIHVWDHVTHRAAIAVSDAAPFSIEIVQPKVPLVRNGSMDLKVVVTRSEGFTAPIALRMIFAPPGVGASGSISIPEGASEAVIPLNANGNAEVRSWKIAVTGEATVGNGPVLVSSQLADLAVADQYFTLAYQDAAVEQGGETDVVVTVANNTPYDQPAEVELLGLPNEVTTEKLTLPADATELVFHVKTTANSPVGQHKTLLCRAVVTQDGEPVTHMLGSGQLQIDKPLPPKADAPPQPVAEAPPADQPAPEKRLTRLEKLRLERQQAKEAKAAAAESKPEPDATEPGTSEPDSRRRQDGREVQSRFQRSSGELARCCLSN